MGRYNKLWAAIVGVLAIILGPDHIDLAPALSEAILGLLTAGAVYLIPNKEPSA